jgi:TRAP-type C4-dicarboxylate transport system permease small subunit
VTTDEKGAASRTGPVVYLGSIALVAAVVIDAASVVGRHLGVPLLGSLELVQPMMLVAGSSAIVVATAARRHAAVHLLLDRVGPGVRQGLQRINSLLSAAFLLALVTGQIWIALDLWGAHEESELLNIPYRPLRLISALAFVITTVSCLAHALRRRSS